MSLLPLFPLRLVVFPNEDLNLHIFEPRYKELVNECMETGLTFGISPFINESLQPIGTEIQLKRIAKKYPDGRMDIETKALGLYQIVRFVREVPDRQYAGAEIQRLEYDTTGDPELSVRIHAQVSELFRVLQVEKAIPTPEELITYDVAHQLGMSPAQEYHLLTLLFEKDRQSFILRHLRRLIPIAREMDELRARIQMNGHFRNVIPPDLENI